MNEHPMSIEIQKLEAEIERLKNLVKGHVKQVMDGWKKERVLKAEIERLKGLLSQSSNETQPRAREP